MCVPFIDINAVDGDGMTPIANPQYNANHANQEKVFRYSGFILSFYKLFTLIEIFNFDISFSGEFSRKVRILQ